MGAMAGTEGAIPYGDAKAASAAGGPARPGRRHGQTRRCIVTGAVRPKAELVRFVLDPDGAVIPDIEETLPGRGLWLTARGDIVEAACARDLFAKAARRGARAPADLAGRVTALLARRCLELLGLARRSGKVAAGSARVRAWLAEGKAAIVLAASDGAAAGRAEVRARARGVPVVEVLTGEELGAALGRGHQVYVAVGPGRLGDLLLRETARLSGFRPEGCGGGAKGGGAKGGGAKGGNGPRNESGTRSGRGGPGTKTTAEKRKAVKV